jgi:hypothetical protein
MGFPADVHSHSEHELDGKGCTPIWIVYTGWSKQGPEALNVDIYWCIVVAALGLISQQ